jgi:hypothetical protein
MKPWVVVIMMLSISLEGLAQNFDLLDKQENIQASIGETLRIPLKIRNNTEKAQFYVVRKLHSDLGATQKGYFCLDKNCLEPGINEFSKRVEAGETLMLLNYVVEGGMVNSQNSVRFQIFPKGSPQEIEDFSVAIYIREKVEKPVVFQSKEITIQDVYPNPVQDQAFIEYQIHNENVKAKLVMHNILGKQLNEMDLPTSETRVKLQTEDFTSGIYFYTLYLDNSGVLTRKLIIRK